MIVWLNVPNAQKSAAKRLGARWSAERDQWYVENVENLEPFMRWMDGRLTQPTKSELPKAPRPGGKQKKKVTVKNTGTNTGADKSLPFLQRIEEWRRSHQKEG
jgi:hypothetical protein